MWSVVFHIAAYGDSADEHLLTNFGKTNYSYLRILYGQIKYDSQFIQQTQPRA